MIRVCYTTHYRKGSAKFAIAARTLAAELAERLGRADVLVEPLFGKADFVAAMERVERSGRRLEQLHFIGHSGMYGPMFGTTRFPEQLSPHEWRRLRIPFARGATAHFHACRSARWFAPFFARTFGVRAYGHHGYTTVSSRPDRFAFEGAGRGRPHRLYLISVPGRKTHGLSGALRKYTLRPAAEPMIAADPAPLSGAGYDAVAERYDRAFSDIRVRRDEWRWLCSRFERAQNEAQRRPRVLDIGCGNGALLAALGDRIASGVGVDASTKMIELARRRASQRGLAFVTVDGPCLPFADASFEIVTSFLSFRYLDWDPILREIRRVLAPGGRLLIVDMVEKSLGVRDAPLFVRSLLGHAVRRVRDRRFVAEVAALGREPAWQTMLRHNPIRAAHEYEWYLESRFPGRKLETLNVSSRARLIAFDSGALAPGTCPPLKYP